MDSVYYHSPPPTRHQLPKASYSPEPTIVSEILSADLIEPRYLGVKKPFPILISSPHVKHLRSSEFVTLVFGDSNRIILKKKKTSAFSYFTECCELQVNVFDS